MRPFSTSRGGRRGTVTVIVVAFLALFFVLALTFAFYALGEAENAKVYNQQASVSVSGDWGAAPDPDPIFNKTLNDVIYGPEEGMPGAYNVIRGHDVSRLMYGRNPADPLSDVQPFNGIGRVPISGNSRTVPDPNTIYPFLALAFAPFPFDIPLERMVNVVWVPGMFGDMMFEIDNNNYRDPRTGAKTPADPTWNYRYYAKNANYTYPDMNNMFLGAMDPRTGKVLLPSYHRPYLMRDLAAGNEILPDNALAGPTAVPPTFVPADTNPWTSAWGRLFALTPRPVDHQWPPGSGQSFFPYPQKNFVQDVNPPYGPVWDGTSGHVQNMPGPEQRMDSVWLDLNFPVRRWQGKNYKPLVAMLIVDLDGRVNVNTAGNFVPLPEPLQPQLPATRSVVPPQFVHGSNQGVGPHEVNLAKVLRTPLHPAAAADPTYPLWSNGANYSANEAAYISRIPRVWIDPATSAAYTLGAPTAHARFGTRNPVYNQFGEPDRVYRTYPNEFTIPTLNMPAPGTGAHFYSQVDYDALSKYSGLPAPASYHQLANGQHTNLIFGLGFVGNPINPMDPPRPHQDSRYGNGMFVPNATPPYEERIGHPSMYSPYYVRSQRAVDLNLAPDRSFGVEEMRLLNEKFYYGPREKFVGSDLALLAPNTLGNPRQAGATNPRFLITTLSSDLAMPGASPWIAAAVSGSYTLPGAPGAYPTGNVQTLQPVGWQQPLPSANPAGTPDHDDNYRAKLVGTLGPIDLNRKLTDYRTLANLPLSPDNIGNRARAILDRQEFAREIFDRLRAVTTGAVPPAPGSPMPALPAPGAPDYTAMRWLAQLAVNIVDFVDNDDLNTPFNWNTAFPTDQRNGWVYGFERPRLVMNETYTRLENMPGDMGVPDDMMPQNLQPTMSYSMRCWIELHNPITPQTPSEMVLDPMGDDGTHGGYRALLEEQVRTNPANAAPKVPQSAYRILMYKVPVAPPMPGTSDQFEQQMRAADNTPGIANIGMPVVIEFHDAAKATAPGGKTIIPNIGAQIGNGAGGKTFYLLGPSHDAPMGMPGGNAELPPMGSGTTADLTHTDLSVQVPEGETNMGNNQLTWAPAFVLQRLADPYSRGGNSTPTDPASAPVDPTNPYVTIDYLGPDMTRISMGDRLPFLFDGMRAANMQPPLEQTFSWGRRQPYDARIDYNDQPHYRQSSGAPMMGQIGGHSFTKHNVQGNAWPTPAGVGNTTDQSPGNLTNGTLQFPFLPLNHLDRVLISPIELLHVAAVKPHEVTHTFHMTSPTNRRLLYTANWLDEPDALLSTTPTRSTFLFRALDFLRTSTNMDGISLGSRVPGKININSQHTATEVFEAVADPSTANRFQTPHVAAAWNAYMNNPIPTSGMRPTPGTPYMPVQFGPTDRPLTGMATAVSAAGQVTSPGQPNGLNSQDRTLARMGAFWQTGQNTEDVVIGNTPFAGGAAEKFELLNKTYNQFTTRSNVFAVYMTVGYFEVMNEGPYNETNRPILGKEIGTDDGAIVRHRYFSVIDRTNLTVEPPSPVLPPNTALPPKQGQPPVYLEYQPSVQLPDASNGFQVSPDPYLLPTPANPTGLPNVPVRIPVQSQVLGAQPPYPPNKPIRLSGYYDGTLWTIWDDPLNTVPMPGGLPQPVTRAILGTGATAEAVTIQIPPNSFEPLTGTATIVLFPDNDVTPGQFRFQHHRGETLRIVNPDPLATATWPTLMSPPLSLPPAAIIQMQRNASVPGNPGPQPGFQYRASRYAPVVRYAEQLK